MASGCPSGIHHQSPIGIHPRALLEFDTLPRPEGQVANVFTATTRRVTTSCSACLKASLPSPPRFAPRPVIVRMSDFKSNEYANLLGGDRYEPHEENPMIGFRGASRYVAPEFRDCFARSARLLRYVRDTMGLTNVEVMIPFVRTTTEAAEVVKGVGCAWLERGKTACV